MIIAPILGANRAEFLAQLDLFFSVAPDCAELRADSLLLSADQTEAVIRDAVFRLHGCCAVQSRFRVLLTLKGESLKLLRRAEAWGVDFVDLEAEALLADPDLTARSRALGSRLIVSAHDFDGIYPIGVLSPEMAECRRRFPEAALKIAYRVADEPAATRFLEWIRELSAGMRVIGVPMGEAGAAARLHAMRYGSFAAYGYLTAPNAPGQPDVRRLLSGEMP